MDVINETKTYSYTTHTNKFHCLLHITCHNLIMWICVAIKIYLAAEEAVKLTSSKTPCTVSS